MSKMILSVMAAVLFVVGLILMIHLTPSVGQQPQETTLPDITTQPITQPPTEIPTEPSTEAPTQPATQPPVTTPLQELEVTATNAFVYDTYGERLVYIGGDMDQRLAPASLTKLLTAHTVLQYMQPEQVVEAGEEVTWIDPNSSIAFILPGHRLTVELLVQALLMQSGNDAAYTLAVATGRSIVGDPELDRRQACGAFVDEMNRQARKLGMENSHFMNPDGIDEDGHYTTARDLLTLTLAVLDNEMIRLYCGMVSDDVEFVSGETCTWYNSNCLLHEDQPYYTPEAVGLKTGSTDNAGKCLISLFRQAQGHRIVCVLGSETDESRYEDTLALYHGFETE